MKSRSRGRRRSPCAPGSRAGLTVVTGFLGGAGGYLRPPGNGTISNRVRDKGNGHGSHVGHIPGVVGGLPVELPATKSG